MVVVTFRGEAMAVWWVSAAGNVTVWGCYHEAKLGRMSAVRA